MKKITINSCDQCPHYKTEDAAVTRKPRCVRAKQTLPYDVAFETYGRAVAQPTNQIPDWCPLDDDVQEAIEVLPWSGADHTGVKEDESAAEGVLVHHRPTGIMAALGMENYFAEMAAHDEVGIKL